MGAAETSAVLGSERFPVFASPLPIIWQEKLPRDCASHPKSPGPIHTLPTLGEAVDDPGDRDRPGRDPVELGEELNSLGSRPSPSRSFRPSTGDSGLGARGSGPTSNPRLRPAWGAPHSPAPSSAP